MYKHYFRCAKCGGHVVTYTDGSAPWQPANTHGGAIEGGASPMHPRDTAGSNCLGVLTYCAGSDPGNEYKPCAPPHRGSEPVPVAAETRADPDWDAFAAKVTAAWNAFVASGYSPGMRGANNFREYRAPSGVLARLRAARGAVAIGGATYTISNSLHADVSLHRAIPAARQAGNIRSFVFHL